MGPLNLTVELGRARRKHKQPYPQFLAGRLKLGVFDITCKARYVKNLLPSTWMAARPHRGLAECPGNEFFEKVPGVLCPGARVGLHHVPAAYGVLGRKMLEAEPGRELDIKGIQLDEVPGLLRPVILGFAFGVGPAGFHPVFGRLNQLATPLEVG